MAQIDFNWTTKDGINIYATSWPCESPKAVIAFVHGLGEHINRYNHMADFFNTHQIAMIGYDRRGHGKSGGKKGHTPSFDAFLDEIQTLLEHTESNYPGVPVFLYGHSMGGNLALSYALRRKLNAVGLIVSGPHIRLSFEPPALLLAFGRIIKNIYPAFTQGNELDVNHISKNPEEVKKYADDPLVHDRITTMTALSMIDAAKVLDEYKGEMPLPT